MFASFEPLTISCVSSGLIRKTVLSFSSSIKRKKRKGKNEFRNSSLELKPLLCSMHDNKGVGGDERGVQKLRDWMYSPGSHMEVHYFCLASVFCFIFK